MNKYNMMINLNSSYFPFAKVFFRSFFDNVNIDRLEKFYVFDCGLTKVEIEWLGLFNFIEIAGTNLDHKQGGQLHGKEWSEITYTKITNAKTILNLTKIPLFIFDVDSIFIQGFDNLIDFTNDIVVCKVEGDREQTCPSPYIGSFVGFIDHQKSIKFINKWHENIRLSGEITTAWRESPALSIMILNNENDREYKIQEIKESVISHTMFSPKNNNSSIVNIHMKSEGAYGFVTAGQRLTMPHARGYIEQYV